MTALARWQHGEGEPFVLVHGFTGSSLDWTDVVEALAARRRVVTFDHRGHGESPHFAAEAEYSFEALLDDFATLVDELALERFDLLGHSMGGMVALRYALERPARVRSLVLMDTACEPIGGDGGMLHQGIGLAREHGLSNLTEVIVSFLGEGERAEVIKQRVRTKLSQMDVAAFCALGSELLAHGSVRSRLGEMAMPTTVIVGEHDTGLRPAADVLAAGIPGARLEVIAGAAHSPQEEQPDAWLAALDAHFDRLVTASK